MKYSFIHGIHFTINLLSPPPHNHANYKKKK